MKKLLLTLTVVATTALTTYGQGSFSIDNFLGGYVTVDPINQGLSGGASGDYIGGDLYSAEALWAPGTFANTAAFLAASPTTTSLTVLDVTGPSNGGGAGFYTDLGATAVPAGGTYTVMVQAWYNVGYASYAAALGGLKNTGQSALGTVVSVLAPNLPNELNLPAFTVGAVVPEPTTLALAGLGLASLLIFRRRK